jgi:anti-sigma regulatory factor (Ser/Thr protein kinase)
MEVRPPHPADGDDGAGPSSISITCDIDTAVTEMVVPGRWSARLASDVHSGFRKCLAEHPSAIILDLRDLTDPAAGSAAMWLAAGNAATRLRPPVRAALCVSAGNPLSQRLRRIGVTRVVPVYPTMEKARTAVAGTDPPADRMRLIRLPPEVGSVRIARGLVDAACEDWRCPDLRQTSRLVISELVANSVEHAGTELAVSVRRGGTGLHLTVRDGDARLPRLLETPPPLRGSGGHGLRIVDTLAAAWGCLPTRDGKMVWATMRSYRRPLP